MTRSSIDPADLAAAGRQVEKIPVHITYDIIRLFSEGLYRSPHKAVEELVTNGYDAGAERVHVLLPEQSEDTSEPISPLWVIDDGHGMDASGFHQLWRVADSSKARAAPHKGRAPIGQFGIGKLAAYVLAWKLTHISCVQGRLLLTSMNFRNVTSRQAASVTPEEVSLREVDDTTAKAHLAEIQERDPAAWDIMFKPANGMATWTAAGLYDFKDLYNKMSAGRLRWVLSTGLPLHTNFQISLNHELIQSSKENLKEIKSITLGGKNDSVFQSLSLSKNPAGNIAFPGIGEVTGSATIYERQLTTGKSEDVGRSNGFFIRVRGRVINLDDELFGIEALNHAAWSRFALEVDADGLRDHLLSSREGVRDSEHIQLFRGYLRAIFNSCRSAYESWQSKDIEELDIGQLLSDTPSAYVTDPLLHSVRTTLETGLESFYIDAPRSKVNTDSTTLLQEYQDRLTDKPFDKTLFKNEGPNAPALRYDPSTGRITVNVEHPFVDKLTTGDKNRNPAKLFASSEVLLEGQLQDQGISPESVNSFIRDRDRVLRLMAGDDPPTATEVLRRIKVASHDHAALERAVGAVFQVLGFRYERKGGNAPGPDGILYASLGRHKNGLADYKLVYDAKQTNQPSVPADKVDIASLEVFRREEGADFGFFIANEYAGEGNPCSRLNGKIMLPSGKYITLLKIEHLYRLVWLHYCHGITLTRLRKLFDDARTVPEVTTWIESLEQHLRQQGDIPLRDLLDGLEEEKLDPKATPSIVAVRAKRAVLGDFEPERLTARLKAVENIVGERWIEVDEDSGQVIMHQTADQILSHFHFNIDGLTQETGDRSPHSVL